MRAKALVGSMLFGSVAPVGIACSVFAGEGGVVAVTLGGLFVLGLAMIAGSYFDGVAAEARDLAGTVDKLQSPK